MALGLAALAVVVAAFQLLVALTGGVAAWPSVPLLLAAGAGFLAARLLHAHPRLATSLVAATILIVSPGFALLYPGALGLLLLPPLAFALVLPRVRGMEVAAFAAAALSSAGAVLAIQFGRMSFPTSVDAIDFVAGTIAAESLVMAAIWRQQRGAERVALRLDQVINDAPVGIARFDGGGRFLEVNQTWLDILGYPDRAALEAASPVTVGTLLEPHARPEDLRLDSTTEARLARFDGSPIWCRIRTRLTRTEHGAVRWMDRTLEDITAERGEAEAKAMLASIVESAHDAIFSRDLAGTILTWNPAAEQIYGWRADEIIGRSVTVLASTEDQGWVDRVTATVSAGGRIGPVERQARHRDGSTRTVSIVVTPIRDASGKVVAASTIGRDLTEQRRLQARLDRWRHERATIAASLAELDSGRPAADAAADICRVLTRSGLAHAQIVAEDQAGSMAILSAWTGGAPDPLATMAPARARRLHEQTATGVWIEEFTDVPAPANVAILRVGALAHLPVVNANQRIAILSVGIADGRSAELIERLPGLTEFAAIAGTILAPQIRLVREAAEAGRQTRAILAAGSFQTVFQPIIELADGAVVGYEALTRFAEGSPQEIFEAAARAGLGIELEAATIRSVLAAARTLPDRYSLSINVSPELILAYEPLSGLLEGAPHDVILEVTEHHVIPDYESFRSALGALGTPVRLAVDDAGAGYSSLRHIVELRPAIVKVDRALIAGVDTDLARQGVIAGMVEFAARVEARLVAEGVEREAEADVLRSLGVTHAQGFLFGRPAPLPLELDGVVSLELARRRRPAKRSGSRWAGIG